MTDLVIKARYTRDGRLISRVTEPSPSSATSELADLGVKALLSIIDVQGLRKDSMAEGAGVLASNPCTKCAEGSQ